MSFTEDLGTWCLERKPNLATDPGECADVAVALAQNLGAVMAVVLLRSPEGYKIEMRKMFERAHHAAVSVARDAEAWKSAAEKNGEGTT